MVRHSAENQARYRKARTEREPHYKHKESERVKGYYTTTSMLSSEEKQERRRKGKESMRRQRDKKKQKLAVAATTTAATAGPSGELPDQVRALDATPVPPPEVKPDRPDEDSTRLV